jgi:hypothetical protein
MPLPLVKIMKKDLYRIKHRPTTPKERKPARGH